MNEDIDRQVVYDPRGHTFVSWTSLMCEQYGSQNLVIVNDEKDWQSWAAGLKAIDLFVNQDVPDPYGFANWQEWAQRLADITT